jgi:hypothetical protein
MRVCTGFHCALAAWERRPMKMRSIVFAVVSSICFLSIPVALATDAVHTPHRETTFLMVEADLRLHLCHSKEFSLQMLRQPSRAAIATDSPAPPGPISLAMLIPEEHILREVSLLCRKGAEEVIRTRLQAAEQEPVERPLAREKPKGFVAA